jgi:hypothetical protein
VWNKLTEWAKCISEQNPFQTNPPKCSQSGSCGNGGSDSSGTGGSYDPNSLIGPSGYGAVNLVQTSSQLNYQINFENAPTATAPAQNATISDSLSANFDWSTFQLTEIAFGNTFISVPPGTQHFTAVESMTFNGVSFNVQIDAGIHLSTGQVYAQFTSIDPITGLPPPVGIGFLPPEDGTGRGQGYISFTVSPKAGLPDGTAINNTASIVFDNEPAITTNQSSLATWSGALPIVTTGTASGLTSTSATLNGTASPNGYSTSLQFQYGLTTAYGTTVNATPSPVTGSSEQSVSAAISGLQQGTLYHYQIIATDSFGTWYGDDATFTTLVPPYIASVSPTVGAAGKSVTITGTNFGDVQGASTVKFNVTPVSQYTSWSDTQIVCNVPAGAATGPVTVTTPGGTSNGVDFTVVPGPAITSLSPNSGPAETLVTISGKNFGSTQGSSVVYFGAVQVTTYISWSDTKIKCKVPEGASTGPVTVTTDMGPSNGVTFTAPPPAIQSISPSSGPAGTTVVTITGKGFGATQGSSVVKFNTVPAGAYTSWSATKIVCTVPAGAGSGPVTVNTAWGTSNGVNFTVTRPPVVSSISPASGPVGAQVTIKGSGFGAVRGKSIVKFNGVSAGSYVSWSDAQIVCEAPANASTGPVTVATAGGTSNGVTFTVIPVPTITSLSPSSGPVGTLVTIAGKNFQASQGEGLVKFNGVTASNYTSWSDAQIKCSVPSGASTGLVTVATSGGISKGKPFKVTSSASLTTAGPDQKVAGEGLVSLSGANSILTAKGGAVSYKWRQIDGPPVILADPESVETSFVAPQVGPDGASLSFELSITARDGSKSKGTCIVNISEKNSPPVANAGFSQTVHPSEIVTLNASLSSHQASEFLDYTWKQIVGPSVELSDPTAPEPSLVAPDVESRGESLVFELTVSDAAGLRSRDRCVVNVVWQTDPPQANAGLTQKVKPGSQVTLDASNSIDRGGEMLSYLWTQIFGKPVKLSDPTSIRPTFTAPEPVLEDEELIFELTVTDAAGLQGKDKVTTIVEGSLKK